jgi:hypothetical protein
MFVDNFEDVFDGLGLFKHTLTTYNDEVLKSFINMSSPKLVSTKLYYGMPSMVPCTHFSCFLILHLYYTMMVSTLWRMW